MHAAEQQDVAGLSVGEDLVATHGEYTSTTAHQGEDDAKLDGLGYLPCSLHYLRFAR